MKRGVVGLSQNLAHKCIPIQVWLLISGQGTGIAHVCGYLAIGVYK